MLPSPAWSTTLRQPPANTRPTPAPSCVAPMLPAHLPCRLCAGRITGSVAGTARPPHWAPVHCRQIIRCNTTVDGSHHMTQNIPDPPVCPAHGTQLLALDLREGSRGWVCACGSPPQNPAVHACSHSGAPTSRRSARPASRPTGDRPWYACGPPPPGSLTDPTGSLFRCCVLPLADSTHNANSNGRVMRAWGTFGHTPFNPSA